MKNKIAPGSIPIIAANAISTVEVLVVPFNHHAVASTAPSPERGVHTIAGSRKRLGEAITAAATLATTAIE